MREEHTTLPGSARNSFPLPEPMSHREFMSLSLNRCPFPRAHVLLPEPTSLSQSPRPSPRVHVPLPEPTSPSQSPRPSPRAHVPLPEPMSLSQSPHPSPRAHIPLPEPTTLSQSPCPLLEPTTLSQSPCPSPRAHVPLLETISFLIPHPSLFSIATVLFLKLCPSFSSSKPDPTPSRGKRKFHNLEHFGHSVPSKEPRKANLTVPGFSSHSLHFWSSHS